MTYGKLLNKNLLLFQVHFLKITDSVNDKLFDVISRHGAYINKWPHSIVPIVSFLDCQLLFNWNNLVEVCDPWTCEAYKITFQKNALFLDVVDTKIVNTFNKKQDEHEPIKSNKEGNN